MSSTARQSETLGRFQSLVEEALQKIEREEIVRRIWEKDATVWKAEEAHQKIISNSLGWLNVTSLMSERVMELKAFADEVRGTGFTHLMVLGMGGSSLCPEVFRRTFAHREGYPELLVLDTTDPDTIDSFEQRLDLPNTLFIVASKSGTTIEPLSFYKYFFDRVQSLKGERAGENFVAITDPGTLMERMARSAGFRRIFLNPSDIGGRYSALSYFGMVPAALMGVDVGELLSRARMAMEACAAERPLQENPGARLGSIIGALALEGRDKLTLVADERVSSLGLWIEQLVAESTGKEDKGVVPVVGEPVGVPDVYDDDRVFVAIQTSETDEEMESRLSALERAGYAVVRRNMGDPLSLGAEFFIWEMATAVAGALMQINPFDQPNVQESKDNTNQLLDEFKKKGALPAQTPQVEEGELKIYGTKSVEDESPAQPDKLTLTRAITELLNSHETGDYVALLAYLQETNEHDQLLQAIRTRLRDSLHVATTTGYGPRFLHSTGQLHKGGADSGIFLQLTDDDQRDLTIPGEPYTFSVLKEAQALGDFSSLASRNRRALRFHLGSDAEAGLKRLLDIVREATGHADEQEPRSAQS
jgi:transaldolase/glucose-6-phosphate isomerase